MPAMLIDARRHWTGRRAKERNTALVSLDRLKIQQTAVIAFANVAALAVFGIVAAYWTWGWLAPRPAPRAQAAADTGGGASAAALFGHAQRDQTGSAPTGMAIRLLGIVAATGGRRGYAVMQLEARDILAVPEGNEVAPGITLAKVGIDHVLLERGGIRETLAWPDRSPGAAPIVPGANR
jgi:general secretion pathway protein C